MPDISIRSGVGGSAAATHQFHHYVDSENGDDGNTGHAPGQALETIGALDTIPPGSTIFLAKGSTWREELSISVANVMVTTYGSGAAPILDGSDVLANGSFAKTAGRTNVYDIDVTPEWSSNDWLNAWEDDVFLTRASDLANCDATAGSYFPSAASGTITLYVHASDSSDVTSNGKTYECSIRQHALTTKDINGCQVNGLTLRKCLSDNAVFELGPNGTASNLTVNQGTAHNVYVQTGATVSNVTATGAYYGASTITIFVLNENTPAGEDASFTSCTADGGTENTLATGFSSHVNTSGNFGDVTLTSCTVQDCKNGFDFQDTGSLAINSCTYTGFNNASAIGIRHQDTAALDIDDLTLTLVAGRALTWTGANTTTLTNSSLSWTGAPNTGALYSTVATDLTITGNTFTGIDAVDTTLFFTHAGASVYARTNTFADPFRIYNLDTAGQTLDSDYNTFSESVMRFDILGANYTTVGAYQAGTGQDQNSTVG